MSHLLHTLWNFLAGVGWVMGLLWIGLAVFTFTALLLAYTRWGQSRALEKCMVLSLLAHLLFFGYATTVQIVLGPGHGYFPAFNVTLCEDSGEGGNSGVSGSSGDSASSDNHKTNDNNTTGSVAASADMWTPTPADPVSLPSLADIHPPIARAPWEPSREFRSEPESLPVEAISPPQQEETILAMPPLVRVEETSLPTIQPSEPTEKPFQKVAERRDVSDWSNVMTAAPSLTPSLQNNTAAARSTTDDSPLSLSETLAALPSMSTDTATPSDAPPTQIESSAVNGSISSHGASGQIVSTLPDMYKLRTSADRAGVAAAHGGNAETEKAVQAALKWLAKNQSADGHWAAGDLGAGQGGNVLGQDRKDAGRQADTGVTGLALLSFLAAGHTHQRGDYTDTVQTGLKFLLRVQAPNGNLGGKGTTYEHMYCHAMAACALSEAYGMTKDMQLKDPVQRAIQYTISSQDPQGGGWRYQPMDPGDTSQLGWQLMALKSAEMAGIPFPEKTKQGITKFLENVSRGDHGGLASYRPQEALSRSMTAEALVCRQFLGQPLKNSLIDEAASYILQELPDEGIMPNDYYWYYATLALYQVQDERWLKWNAAMTKTVLARQEKEGNHAGSWKTDSLWGGHGGRAYTTAISALTLEVYYRYLPIYTAAANHSLRR